MRRVRVLTPSFKPVGGVIKIFDYVLHAQAMNLEPVIYCPEPPHADLPLFSIEHLSGLFESVRFENQHALRIENGDIVLFSWPTEYELVAARAAGEISPHDVIHIVQNTRHGNPKWLRGYATRLLMRPLTRIMVAEQVRQACEEFVNSRSLTTTIIEGHNWKYFALERTGGLGNPIRVGYTTWKSDIGCRVEAQLEGSSKYVFRHIGDTVGWKELRELYQWSDVFLACPGPQEGFYLPGLEAMAAGAILVTPDVEGNMQYCDFGTNCLEVEFDRVESYVAALQVVISMAPAEIRRLREGASRTIAEHTLERERTAFSDLLTKIGGL